MQTWEAIRSRRNVRSFEDRPIADDHLDEILESGRRSPSSQNWQPWDFILVRQREQLLQLAHVWRGAGHVAHAAAAIALIAPLPKDERQRNRVQYDLGQATMSIMLAAASLGIGSGHASVSDQDLARGLLGFPGDRFCAYLISLGYPADRPLTLIRHPDRRPFDEVVHRDRWLRVTGYVTGTIFAPATRPSAMSSTPSVPCGWRRRSVGEPGLKIRNPPSAEATSSGMCEWPNTTRPASGNRPRSRASRPAAGPLSCTIATRRPSTVTTAVSGAPQAATSGPSLLPMTAVTGAY